MASVGVVGAELGDVGSVAQAAKNALLPRSSRSILDDFERSSTDEYRIKFPQSVN